MNLFAAEVKLIAAWAEQTPMPELIFRPVGVKEL